MPVTNTPIFPQTIKNAVLNIVNGTGTTITALYVAGSNGSKVESFNVSSTDTSAQVLQVYATISAVNYLIGSISIPITSGSISTVVSVDILRSSQIPSLAYDANGNRQLYLANGTTLSVGMVSPITSGKTMTIFAQVGDY